MSETNPELLKSVEATFEELSKTVDVKTPKDFHILRLAKNLFRCFIAIDENRVLARVLINRASSEKAKTALLKTLTKSAADDNGDGKLSDVLLQISNYKYDSESDFLHAIQDIAINAIIYSADYAGKLEYLEKELIGVIEVISTETTLNKILSDKTLHRQRRIELVDTIFRDKVDARTFALLKHSTSYITKRRFLENLKWSSGLISKKLNKIAATVFSPFEFSEIQRVRLGAKLETKYNKKVDVSVIYTPDLISGMQLMIGTDYIDTSVKTKLKNFVKEAII
jgi:F-type H+-transporting ATPase subunit delta